MRARKAARSIDRDRCPGKRGRAVGRPGSRSASRRMTRARAAPPIRMSLRMTLREVTRRVARKPFRMAKAIDANIGAVHRPLAEPDGSFPTFRIRQELLTFRFVELLTRTPTPRPLRSSSWGYGSYANPSPGSSGDCAIPTTPGITNPGAPNSHRVRALTDPESVPCPRPPRHHQSSRCRFPWGPSPGSSGDCTMPTTPSITNPHAAGSRGVQALSAPATAPSPGPLASPIPKLQVPVGSEPWQLRRLHHAHNPCHPQTS